MEPGSRADAAPPPDPAAEPAGFVVLLGDRDRIHFLDWGGPSDPAWVDDGPGVLLVHGLAATAWTWTPVARRLRAARHTVAMDLRGHGLSDAPTTGYDPGSLAEDVIAVAEGAGVLAMDLGPDAALPPRGLRDEARGTASTATSPRQAGDGRVVLAGHGYGAIVAAWAAAILGERCAGLVLVDGGWEDLRESTGLEPDEFLREIEEPPEVLRSMEAYLADRAAFHPPTWDTDQEAAARAAVVVLPVGRVELAIHDHVRDGSVAAMFAYDPVATLAAVRAPITILAAADDEAGTHGRTLAAAVGALSAAGRTAPRIRRFPRDGHALMRYRPAEVTAAILVAATVLPTDASARQHSATPEEPT